MSRTDSPALSHCTAQSRPNETLFSSEQEAEIVHAIRDYPPPPVGFDGVSEEERTRDPALDWDAPWKHYEGALSSSGFEIFWWDSGIPGLEDSVTRHDADSLPPPKDPLAPLTHEAIAHYPLGHTPERQVCRERKAHAAYDQYGRRVFIKAVRSNGSEASIAIYLAIQRRFHPDRRNHTIPFLDIVRVGDWTFLVMPDWRTPLYPYNVGEYVEWFKQCLEGLVYMHEHNIAFRDVSTGNVLWSYGGDWSPPDGKPFASSFDARYAYIDFGQSTQFPPGSPPEARRVTGTIHTPEFAPPELSDTEAYDPFAVDVYALGKYFYRMIRPEVRTTPVPELICYVLPDFFGLTLQMTKTVPSRRPTAAAALSRLDEIISSASPAAMLAPGCDWLWGTVEGLEKERRRQSDCEQV